ncbi:LysR substrate-binding domain-containing protein [Kribbella sp. NBC_00482]|uniref:LysR substrate-binding domain-containing protein n=1 Tax=Kribbella sp. NBC_00482 TaxID=2975968 RepID=UPI002E188D2A
MHKISDLIDLWEKKFEERVRDGKRSPTSLETYRRVIKNHIRPAFAELRIGEATTQRIDTAITNVKNRTGAPTAKTCRAVLSGMMKIAVRYGAISVNPVRENESIEAEPKNPPRALTGDEVTLLRKHLAANDYAVRTDLPDLVTFMLATGVRIGEALAVRWSQADLEAGTVEFTHTIARLTGHGLIRKRPKSKAGERLLHLPNWGLAILRTRHAAGIRLDNPIFADTIGGYRDPSNTRRALRTVLSPVGSTARRDLGLTLRALRRQAGLTRKDVAELLTWPKTRMELVETGRIKVDHQLVADLVKIYKLTLDHSPDLLIRVDQATQPTESDKLAWIKSHALRKTTATALDQAGHTARHIADRGSLVGAADAMHITQPVVTRGLREVEDILGVSLFDRGPRGVTPTVFGDSFLEHARAVLAQLRQAGQQIDQLTNADLGTVTVGTHLAGSNVLLPRAIAALKAEHPRLTVVVREATPDMLQAAILAGDCDLIVGRLTGKAPSSLVQQMLYSEPVRLVAREGHPVHALDSPTLMQLADYPWIFPVEQTILRSELEDFFVHEGVPIPANRIECTSMLTLRELLISTDVIAALPMLIAAQDDNLKLISTHLTSIRRAVGVTMPADRPLSPAANALLASLRDEATGLAKRTA